MICKLKVQELQVGMRIIGHGLGWQMRPHTYNKDLDITSWQQIVTISRQGYTEAFVYLPDRPEEPALQKAVAHAPKRPPCTSALAEELPKARTLHSQCTAYAHKFMGDMGNGKFTYTEAEPFVEKLLASTERNPGALLSLARLHAQDAYTYRHCINVSILAIVLAQYLGKSSNEIFIAGYAGLFHDLGKALIPQQVLNAQRKLNPAEFRVIQKHPSMGYNALLRIPHVQEEVLDAALQHHEKFDGSGYPAGLAGDEITRIGCIVGMADVYDALTSKRAYKEAFSPSRALAMMYQQRNLAWKENLLTDFIQMLGVYPVGSVVELEDGTLAVVTDISESSVRPHVVVIQSPDGEAMFEHKNLASSGEPAVALVFSAEEKNIDVMRVLAKSQQ